MSIYSPLTPGRQEIRLLTLFAEKHDENIQLSLQAVCLDENPVFEALSYCWGDPDDRVGITLNGLSFLVTRNLEIALRHWRSVQDDLVIWVDALCINQEDSLERASQVSIMGKIYASASRVRAWLGEESSDSNIAMDFLGRVEAVDFTSPDTVIDSNTMIAVKKLLRRPWWTRLWIVQEALLAKELTFYCGGRKAQVKQFIKFQEEYSRLRWDTMPHLRALRSHISGPLSVLLWSWDDYRAQIGRGGISLSQMITVTAQSQYSVPQDRIFALLGVCSEIERRVIPIDYNMTTRNQNILISKYFLISRRAHHPLYYLQLHQSGKDPSLPSWASDFTTPDEENHISGPSFRAGADNYAWAALGLPIPPPAIGSYNSLDVKFEDEGSFETLVVPGLIVDKVTAAFQSPQTESYDGFDVDEEQKNKLSRRKVIAHAAHIWWKHVQRTLPREPDPYAETCGRYEAFWRTLIMNHGISVLTGAVTAEMDFGDKFESWIGRTIADEDYFKPYSDPAVSRCMWRSFLVTRKGYFGLGARNARFLDLICILRGANTPYILRLRPDGCYDLIGEAYVHGVMDGSFVRGAEDEDVQTFRIR